MNPDTRTPEAVRWAEEADACLSHEEGLHRMAVQALKEMGQIEVPGQREGER